MDRNQMRASFKGLSRAKAEALANELSVLQLEQVNEAFVQSGQPSQKWKPLNPPKGSYREGGKPLQDNGHLKISFFILSVDTSGGTMRSTIASSMFYAPFHQSGFKTRGPNYIPITLNGRRHHQPGRNPEDEGLVEGVDYIIAKHGVEVPARPMIDYSDPINVRQIEQTALAARGG